MRECGIEAGMGGGIGMHSSNEGHVDEVDSYRPTQIAARVEFAGIGKIRQSFTTTLLLAVLAGAYIAFGALSYTIVATDSTLGWGPTRFLGGAAFSLGLVLVIVAGAELFTGNVLMVIGWASGRIRALDIIRNWSLVYLGNLIGALATAALVVLSGVLELRDGAVARTAAEIAVGKLQLTAPEALFRGVLCNVLVCLGVWLSFAARSLTDKVLAVLLPISAFVVAGFEHSVANMYVIPVAMAAGLVETDIPGLVRNLLFVTVGNVVGGGALVALTYWVVYIRDREQPRPV
jgi:formate/nitrite transporter